MFEEEESDEKEWAKDRLNDPCIVRIEFGFISKDMRNSYLKNTNQLFLV